MLSKVVPFLVLAGMSVGCFFSPTFAKYCGTVVFGAVAIAVIYAKPQPNTTLRNPSRFQRG